jgi:polyvinyl alcohol dehydrogenase (cytochrome)
VALAEASGHVRWRTFTVPPGHDGGGVWSTPAIDTVTGRLYVGTGNAYHQPAADTTDSMMVLNASTGAILGHFQGTSGDTFAADDPLGPDADFGASANLIAGPSGQSLVGEGEKNGTYWALDRGSMQPVWHATIGPGSAVGGILGSTAYDGSRIYGTDALDGQVWALGRDGALQWNSLDASTLDFSPVAVANDVLYSVNPSGFLMARDAATGAVLNALSLEGFTFGGVSAVGGAIYAAVGTGPPPQPAPQADGPGAIVAFGDTSQSG